MGPMPVVVNGVAVLIESIEAMNVIDDAIGVVVDPVTSGLRHIDPHVSSKILVAVADARIDHRHDRRRGIGPHIPGFGSVDIGIDGSSVLPRVVQRPKRTGPEIGYRRDSGSERRSNRVRQAPLDRPAN